jgi:gas vesicle protein
MNNQHDRQVDPTKFILTTVGLTAFAMMLTKKSFRNRLKRMLDTLTEMAEEERDELMENAEDAKTKIRRKVSGQLRNASDQVAPPPVNNK